MLAIIERDHVPYNRRNSFGIALPPWLNIEKCYKYLYILHIMYVVKLSN